MSCNLRLWFSRIVWNRQFKLFQDREHPSSFQISSFSSTFLGLKIISVTRFFIGCYRLIYHHCQQKKKEKKRATVGESGWDVPPPEVKLKCQWLDCSYGGETCKFKKNDVSSNKLMTHPIWKRSKVDGERCFDFDRGKLLIKVRWYLKSMNTFSSYVHNHSSSNRGWATCDLLSYYIRMCKDYFQLSACLEPLGEVTELDDFLQMPRDTNGSQERRHDFGCCKLQW